MPPEGVCRSDGLSAHSALGGTRVCRPTLSHLGVVALLMSSSSWSLQRRSQNGTARRSSAITPHLRCFRNLSEGLGGYDSELEEHVGQHCGVTSFNGSERTPILPKNFSSHTNVAAASKTANSVMRLS